MGDTLVGFGLEVVGCSSEVSGTFLVSCTSFNKFRVSSLSARPERGIDSADRVLGVFVPEGIGMVASDLASDNTVPASEAFGDSGNTVVKSNQLPSASRRFCMRGRERSRLSAVCSSVSMFLKTVRYCSR